MAYEGKDNGRDHQLGKVLIPAKLSRKQNISSNQEEHPTCIPVGLLFQVYKIGQYIAR